MQQDALGAAQQHPAPGTGAACWHRVGGQEGGQPEGWAAPAAAQTRGCSGYKELSLPGCFSTVGKPVWPGWEAAANTGSLSGGRVCLHGALLAPAAVIKELL